MINMIKKENYNFIKKSSILYALNLIDLFFTLFYTRINFVEEGNPLMVGAIDTVIPAIFIKVIVIGVLLILTNKLSLKFTEKEKKLFNRLLNITIIVYLIIFSIHMYILYNYLTFNL